MGRRSTKENKTIWQITREELSLTREKAGELIPGFSPERIEKIENGRTQIQPEDALLLAEYYKAPALVNYYCCNECPIGESHAVRAESKELTQIAVETLNAVNQMARIKDRLLEIAEVIAEPRRATINNYRLFTPLYQRCILCLSLNNAGFGIVDRCI